MTTKPPVKAYVQSTATCDLCHKSLFLGDTFSDASVPRFGGTWGWLCQQCADKEQVAYGTGLGQKYDSKTYLKIQG